MTGLGFHDVSLSWNGPVSLLCGAQVRGREQCFPGTDPTSRTVLSSNATLPWWFVNLDSAGPRIPWIVAKGLCAKKKV